MWLVEKNIASIYEKEVTDAVINEVSFQTFKSRPGYNNVVGMSNEEQGKIWLAKIQKEYPTLYEDLHRYAKNDTIGTPPACLTFDGIKLSSNTLRYINTILEIEEYFLFKDKPISILELGVGYGGLAFVANIFYNVKQYVLIDLPIVQALAGKYLSTLGINTHITTPIPSPDLFISEFCLSEFDDKQLYEYYEKYLLKSKYFYLHMNMHDNSRKQSFLSRLERDFTFLITDEFPISSWPNYVIRGINKVIL